MKSPSPPAPEIRGKLRVVWDRLSRRQLYEVGGMLGSLPTAEPAVRNALAVWHLASGKTGRRWICCGPWPCCPMKSADEVFFAPFFVLVESGASAH
jgi:hypothetical protein